MADTFVSSTRIPELTQQLAGGSAMSPIYIAPEDFLVVSIWNSEPTAGFTLSGRLLRSDGITVPLEQVMLVNSAGTESSTILTLAEGYLLSASIRVTVGSVIRGQAYGTMRLLRGRHIPTQQYAILATGYVSQQQPLIWPWAARNEALMDSPGFYEVLTATAALGAEWSLAVPAWRTWRVRTVFFLLVTDATVADRRVILRFLDGVTAVAYLESALVQTAGATQRYTWAPGLNQSTAAGASNHGCALPTDLVLRAGYQILGGALNLQAGDALQNVKLTVESFAANI